MTANRKQRKRTKRRWARREQIAKLKASKRATMVMVKPGAIGGIAR